MTIAKYLLSLLIVLSTLNPAIANYGPRSCSQFYNSANGFVWDERRGNPWEFDTGPVGEDSSSWVKLYGQVPNYRSVGRSILGGNQEKFRWTMGPMWYRGRLGKNQVKVFVVGQEGAQDENITNRAFTGSTGTRVQKFLNHLGIYESYLFMNTYVYTIKEQRDLESVNYMALEQDLDSPVVQYRHQLFDNVIIQNPQSISLFLGVGGGGKESLATWINSRSDDKKCQSWALDRCDTSGLVRYFANLGVLKGDEKILAIGVQHPGGNAFGGGDNSIQKSFDWAASSVARFLQKNQKWLPADSQEETYASCNGGERIKRLFKSFRYGYAPIPFKDFSFATNWRMGNHGTSSNRDGAHRIQVFSEYGKYATIYRADKPLGKLTMEESERTVWNDWEPSYLYDERSTRSSEFKGLSYAQKLQILKENTYTAQADQTLSQLKDSKRGLLIDMKDIEVPYEHPRFSPFGQPELGDFKHAAAFDPGPASALIAEALGNWPNFAEINNQAYFNHPSFGFGPSYRGNTKNPKVLIIADQMGHSDFFSTRALTGAGGQWLQSFLKHSGLEESNSYLILRSLPVDTLNYSDTLDYLGTLTPENLHKQTLKNKTQRDEAVVAREQKPVQTQSLRQISTQDKINLALNKDSNGKSVLANIQNALASLESQPVVITMGPIARAIAQAGNIHSIIMDKPNVDLSHIAQWIDVAHTLKLQKIPTNEELSVMTSIPRRDLPYSTRWWMGTTGERAERAFGSSIVDQSFNYEGHYYRVVAPDWSSKLNDDPRPLNEVEKSLVDKVLQKLIDRSKCEEDDSKNSC